MYLAWRFAVISISCFSLCKKGCVASLVEIGWHLFDDAVSVRMRALAYVLPACTCSGSHRRCLASIRILSMPAVGLVRGK